MKTQIILASSVAFFLTSLPVLAASRTITINDLAITNGRQSIKVPAGDGVVMDLSETGQIVRGVVFGDATKFVITGVDGQLCYMQQDKCRATGASVVSFRQVKDVEILTQSHSPDGSTTVTLITDGKLGRKVLHMRLKPVVKSTYTAIVVKENPPPLVPVVASSIPTRSTRSRLVSSTNTTTFPLQRSRAKFVQPPLALVKPVLPLSRPSILGSVTQRSDANALAIGLSHGIEPRSTKYKKAQNAIIALRKGRTREEAALVSGLELDFINRLIYIGRQTSRKF